MPMNGMILFTKKKKEQNKFATMMLQGTEAGIKKIMLYF